MKITDKTILLGGGAIGMSAPMHNHDMELKQAIINATKNNNIHVIVVDNQPKIDNERIFQEWRRGNYILGHRIPFKTAIDTLNENNITSYIKLYDEYQLIQNKQSNFSAKVRRNIVFVYEKLFGDIK